MPEWHLDAHQALALKGPPDQPVQPQTLQRRGKERMNPLTNHFSAVPQQLLAPGIPALNNAIHVRYERRPLQIQHGALPVLGTCGIELCAQHLHDRTPLLNRWR